MPLPSRWFPSGLLLPVLLFLMPGSVAAEFCSGITHSRLQEARRGLWAVSQCRAAYSEYGREPFSVGLEAQGSGHWRITAAGEEDCGWREARIWVDGEGPHTTGTRLELDPGWHRVYAEGSVNGRVRVALEEDMYLCSQDPEMECHLRDFHFRGEELNALLSRPPVFEWSGAENSTACRAEACVRSCPTPAASMTYKVLLDKKPVVRGLAPGTVCEGRWEMPERVWEDLDPGFHTLTVQAQAAGSEGRVGVVPRTLGFSKVADPSRVKPASSWPSEREESHRIEGRLACGRGCVAQADTAVLPVSPQVKDPLIGTLLGLSGNLALQNTNEAILYADWSLFRGGRDPGSRGVRLSPRILPTEIVRRGSNWVYKDLMKNERGEALAGHCGWSSGKGRMDGIAGCRNPWIDPVADHPEAQIYWQSIPKDGLGAAWVQAVRTDLAMTPDPQIYVAVFQVRELQGRAARLRLGWDSETPRVRRRSKIPTHRSLSVRLDPGERREVALRIQMAPPPGRPDGRGGRLPSPLIGGQRALWIVALADWGRVLVEDIRLHPVQEGFLVEGAGIGDTPEVGLYFRSPDRLPSPTRVSLDFLSPEELARWAPRRSRVSMEVERVARRPLPGEGPSITGLAGPFVPAGPHGGPGAEEWDGAGNPRPAEVILARNQKLMSHASFRLVAGAEGLRRALPGRGELEACGNRFRWELWTSRAFLSQGPGWTWWDAVDTPLMTHLFLTKGGSVHYDGRRTQMRVDEAMPLMLESGPWENTKLLLQLHPKEPLRPGACEARIALDQDLDLPLRIQVLDVDLAPERNQWVQLGATRRWDGDGEPANGCNFEVNSPDATYRQHNWAGCGEDEMTEGDWRWICDDDFDYLARRIREHGHIGVSVRDSCEIVEGCVNPDVCPADPLGFHAARCRTAPEGADRRRAAPFSDLVRRVAGEWDKVSPLPKNPPYRLSDLKSGESIRPWLGANVYPGVVPIPHCWSEEGVRGCPKEASGRMAMRSLPGPRFFASLRSTQEYGLAARPFVSHMDNLAGGGVDRAAGFAVLLEALAEMGAGANLTSFSPDREASFMDLLQRVRVETSPPESCSRACEVDPSSQDVHDLERQLRWGELYGSDFSSKPTPDWCPGPDVFSQWMDWARFGRELNRLRQLSDRKQGCGPDRCGPECYCCGYSGGGADLCEVGRGGSYAPLGRCEDPRPCRADPGERRRWCPRFAAGRTLPATGQRRLPLIAYSVGLDRFLVLQEDCEPGRPCRWKPDGREQQGMFEEVVWKWPLNSRFSSGFWAAASNLDAFHPYHLYFNFADGNAQDDFSNFEARGGQSVGFIYKADSRRDPTGAECDGSCSGIVMTESWSALAAGHMDIRWWDTLLAHEAKGPCRREKEEAVAWIRREVLPHGVGRSAGGSRAKEDPNIPQRPNFWKAPGFPAESLGDADLQRMRVKILDALTCRAPGGN